MDKVTLTHESYLSFTGWNHNHALKQTQSDRVNKLAKMGMKDITTEGRGKKATYTFIIPSGFWRMLLIPAMSYTKIGADYVTYLIEGKDLQRTDRGTLVRFGSEILIELARKHHAPYKRVEATCGSIKRHLLDHGYIYKDGNEGEKNHRVKKRLDDGWVTGNEALMYDQMARKKWEEFFKRQLTLYQELCPGALHVPTYICAAEAKKIYQHDMARDLGVAYYKVAKRTNVTDNMISDINYVRQEFLSRQDLSAVRMELASRQEQYKAEKERRDDERKLRAEQEKEAIPSKDERKGIKDKLTQIARSKKFSNRNMTQAQIEELDRAVAAAFDLSIEELHKSDLEQEREMNNLHG
ncbi:hypothetical protein [Alkalihalophilus marmarensis]|uniref:hypothetical protein n=1 Tax=Alkalihalophilus marmarensis TaxID=521377 RepID=UPI002E1F1595|nr:hypothetical protein [Alkalihalophilus marmarensis]